MVNHRAYNRRMTLPEYEYKGLMAQAWDVLRGDTSNWSDRFFFLDAIKRYGQPVLDVGCGTGRLLLDFLAQGIDADGVDNSPDMLSLCRQRAAKLGLQPTLYEQYMETLDLPRLYQTILVPSSSLQLIIDPGMVDQSMQRLKAHLLPGGVLIAPFMLVCKPGDPLEAEWERSATRAEDGAVFRRVSRSRYDPHEEVEHTEDMYQMIVDGRVVAEELHRRSPATRNYTQAQARALFERAGFAEIEVYGEFDFAPVKPDDAVFVVVGHKAA
jgi:ubiquinone/menaquinone biosynthesis C-methylase UbiE